MKHLPLVLACAVVFPGCLVGTEVNTSSLTYLTTGQSGATSAHAPVDAAREVTRLFGIRGVALAEQHQITGSGGYAIRLTKSDRGIAATKDDSLPTTARDVGSVYYVWVVPSGSGSTVTMVGKPTLDGAEPCSPDAPGLACSASFDVDPTFASAFLSGKAEADVVQGVLSELELEGFASAGVPAQTPIVPGTPAGVPHDVCEQQRHDAFAHAQATQDLDARAQILKSAPEC
jgi:hypothetical protein